MIRRADPSDRAAIESLLDTWGMRWVARLDELRDVLDDPAMVALDAAGRLIGLATYRIVGTEVEITTLQAAPRGEGTGSALVEAVADAALAAGAIRLWLVTTNDNVDALRFYQRRGFQLAQLRPGAVDRSRATLKPSIPAIGDHGIAIRDELVLERRLPLEERP